MNFRSGLEERFGKLLDKNAVPYLYEVDHIKYTIQSRYTPDFSLPNGVIIETKGFFKPSDRSKHIAIKAQHPELDIRFVFQRNNTLSKKSKTTYGDWATKHNFLWCIFPNIPPNWLL